MRAPGESLGRSRGIRLDKQINGPVHFQARTAAFAID